MVKTMISGLMLISVVLSYTIDGYVDGTSEGTVYLNGSAAQNDGSLKALPEQKSKVDSRGYFFFDKLIPGSYKLTVSAPEAEFSVFMAEVTSAEGVSVYELDLEKRERRSAQLPLTVSPTKRFKYFEVREPFNLNNFLKSPYGIMISITVAMMICMKNMPKMEDLQAADQAQRNN